MIRFACARQHHLASHSHNRYWKSECEEGFGVLGGGAKAEPHISMNSSPIESFTFLFGGSSFTKYRNQKIFIQCRVAFCYVFNISPIGFMCSSFIEFVKAVLGLLFTKDGISFREHSARQQYHKLTI